MATTPPAKTANKPTAQQPTKTPPPAAKPTQQTAQQGTKTMPPAAKQVSGQVLPKEDPKPAAVPAVSNIARTPAVAADNLPADLPDYIKRGVARGSEQVEQSDLIIPRIELVQALSECLKEGSAAYIEGAKAGMLYNSVTRQLYGESVFVIPVYYSKQYLGWRDRKKGGGFCGAHDTLEACQVVIDTQENPEEWEAIETGQQVVLVVDPENGYSTEEAIISCARTKFKVSRQWNSMIRLAGFDRFSRYYEVFGVEETNSQNQDYHNLGIKLVDWTPKSAYEKAEALYNSIASGDRVVKMDDNFEDIGMGANEPSGEGEPDLTGV